MCYHTAMLLHEDLSPLQLRELRTVRRAAELCRVPWRTLYGLIERGDLRVAIIDRVKFVDPADIRALIEAGRLRQR